jgi:Flp pilus assembly pilin Flp
MYRILMLRWGRLGMRASSVGSTRVSLGRRYSRVGHCRSTEDGVSTLEYVLLVALVAMIALGSLVYLGSGSGSPAHVANNVGNNVSGDAAASGAGAPIAGTSTGTPVKAWCASGESGCTDPMEMNGQTEVIHFQVTGGTQPYTYQLQGSVPPFVIPDWPDQKITVQPDNCKDDPGAYDISLVVTDSTGATGQLNFTLNVATGSLCQG